MIATLTDKSMSLNKEITDADKASKDALIEIRATIVQCQSDMRDVNIKINDLTRKVNENANQARSGFSSGNLPGEFLTVS